MSKTASHVGKDLRIAIKESVDYECELCGEPETRLLTLQIHHIRPISDGGDNNPKNLMVLCPNCHCKVHNMIKH